MRPEVRWLLKKWPLWPVEKVEKPRYVPGWEPGLRTMGRPRRWQGPNRTRLKQLQGRANRVRQPCPAGMDLTDGFDGGFTDLPEKTATGNGFWWRLSLVMWCRCCRLNLRMKPPWFWEVRWSWAFVGTLRVTFERARRLVCPVGCGDKIFETYLDEKVSLLIICCMVSKERGSYCKPLNSPRIQPFLAMRQLLWWEQPYRLWWNGWNLKAKRVCQGTPILPTLFRIFTCWYLILYNDIDWWLKDGSVKERKNFPFFGVRFQEAKLELSLMQGNFGFIQTMRAMDQKSSKIHWLVMILPMKLCIAHWVCPIMPYFSVVLPIFQCSSDSVFLRLERGKLGLGWGRPWTPWPPWTDEFFLAAYEMVRSFLGARPQNQSNQDVPSGND